MIDFKKVSLALKSNKARKEREKMRLGGVVSLKSYLAATSPEVLNKIVGYTADVIAEFEFGKTRVFINLPLSDGTYMKLRVNTNDICADEYVDISSIVVLFMGTIYLLTLNNQLCIDIQK